MSWLNTHIYKNLTFMVRNIQLTDNFSAYFVFVKSLTQMKTFSSKSELQWNANLKCNVKDNCSSGHVSSPCVITDFFEHNLPPVI